MRGGKKVTGGEIVAAAIHNVEIDTVFGLVGNQISPILVHLKKNNIQFIGTRHEQAAVHMADGWAQCNRKCGMAMVSGGPGFTNTVNAITKAYYAETPVVVITGGIVHTQRDRGNLQDMEQISIVKNVCKWAFTIYDANRIEEYIYRAVNVAMNGRKGPVVIEIPINVLRSECKERELCIKQNILGNFDGGSYPSRSLVERICDDLIASKRPLILLGDEVYYSKEDEMVRQVFQQMKIPVATINKARGLISDDEKFCIGNGRVLEDGPQMYAVKNADLILVLGVRWDYQMNSFEAPTFTEQQKIIYVTENQEFMPYRENTELVLCKMSAFIETMCQIVQNGRVIDYKKDWFQEIHDNEKSYWNKILKNEMCRNRAYVSPLKLLMHISKFIDKDTIMVLDGSNSMFWAGLIFRATAVGQIIIGSDGQHGSMGCGIPLALGAKKANPDKKVLLYTGDGSVGFNIAEFDTSIRYKLPITVIVHNDEKWGLCETTQKILYEEVCGTLINDVDYSNIAKGFGGYGDCIMNDDDIVRKINKETLFQNKLMCFDAKVDGSAYSPGLIVFNETLKKMK